MSELIPLVVALSLMTIGSSYLLHTARWISLVRRLSADPGALFPGAMVMVAAGVTIGHGYDDWSGTWHIFVTLLGWLLAVQGAGILLLPAAVLKVQHLSDRFLRYYLRYGGLLLVLLGILLWRSLGTGAAA
jgi:hypothetical protein